MENQFKKKVITIVTIIVGSVLFGYGIYLAEHDRALRHSSINFDAFINANEVNETNLPKVEIKIGDVDEVRVFSIKEEGVARKRTQSMMHMQSSIPLSWMSNQQYDKAMSFGTLEEDHESEALDPETVCDPKKHQLN